MQQNRLKRLIDLVVLLVRQGPQSRTDLAAALGVTKETIVKDTSELAKCGVVVPVGEGQDTRWAVADQTGFGPGTLDRLCLRMGRDVFGFLEGTSIAEVFERVDAAADLGPRFLHQHEPRRLLGGSGDGVEHILAALLQTRRIDATYRRGGSPAASTIEIEPLTLVMYRQALYLIGLVHEEPQVFALDRFVCVTVGEKFRYPPDWDPQTWLGATWGVYRGTEATERVVLEFSAERAHLVRAREWRPGAQASLEELADGRVKLSFLANGPALVSFVLEWGPHCRVVAPARLRERVAGELRAALAHYPSSDTEHP
jgi:predicted DNA-binding transcriptional regulator YafY